MKKVANGEDSRRTIKVLGDKMRGGFARSTLGSCLKGSGAHGNYRKNAEEDEGTYE